MEKKLIVAEEHLKHLSRINYSNLRELEGKVGVNKKYGKGVIVRIEKRKETVHGCLITIKFEETLEEKKFNLQSFEEGFFSRLEVSQSIFDELELLISSDLEEEQSITEKKTSSELIVDLIKCWDSWDKHEVFYLTKFVPSLVANPERGNKTEKPILYKLKKLLDDKEWRDLPRLIAEKRTEILRDIENESIRLKEMKEKTQTAIKEWQEKRHKKNAMLQEIRSRFHSDFLGVDVFFQEFCGGLITEKEFETEKFSFVKSWITANTPIGRHQSEKTLDNEQIAAIASLHGNIQVVARAGSGKTTTLVMRTLFLLKHCRIAPSEILILAFNRKAALEVRRRLLTLIEAEADEAISADIERRRIRDTGKSRRIDMETLEANAVDAIASRLNVALPHIMTFHALAYAIVHPEEGILYDGAEGESQNLSRAVQKMIDDHLQMPEFNNKIRRLMLAHFREDWDLIVNGRYDLSKEEFLRFRRSLQRECFGGEYVKSYGEKIIADFLFEHDIQYKYERNHWWDGINYRPDFTIFKTQKSGVIIEYFGLKGDADYDENTNKKRAYWKGKKDWVLIEFSPVDITSNGFEAFLGLLKIRLEEQGIRCTRLSEDEIWQRIEDRAIFRYTKALVNFIGRCRQQSLSSSDLQKAIENYLLLSFVEGMFLDLACYFYDKYLVRLSATGEDDFNGLMQKATEAVHKGITNFQRKSGSGDLASLRYVSIDEFQDFSDLFFRLLSAIRQKNPTAELFCVGDDWQAINGFAGSDLKFFTNFDDQIEKSRRLYISTNYRSSDAIVDVSNALMTGFGKPAFAQNKEAGKVLVADLSKFKPTLIEKESHSGDIITPVICRLANSAMSSDMNMVMLCREKTLPYYVNYKMEGSGQKRTLHHYRDLVLTFFPKNQRERISISTVHKYKGLEKPMVIIIDAVNRRYPLIHPDWIFSRILGESLERIAEEERRLFYVALTRAVSTLVIITEERCKSPFLEDLERCYPLSAIKWDNYPPPHSGMTTRLVVKIKDQARQGRTPTFNIKDTLKACGYRWKSADYPCWEKSYSVKGFKIEVLQSEVWAELADGIDIRIFNDTEVLVAHFLINDGNWQCVIDKL